jgi:peptide/nickel transport system substrate-binding protein
MASVGITRSVMRCRYIIALTLLYTLAVLPVHAGEESWPRAWFEPAKTASELGITSFSQSPLLDSRGMPPVADRLPADPVVVVPLDGIGRYGGVVRVTRDEWLTYPNVEGLVAISADLSTPLPNLAESWEVSSDGRSVTITLREGIKWSDGVPLTSDDFVFMFNDLLLNKEYSPVTPQEARGGKVVRISDLVFRYVFVEPNPLVANMLANTANRMYVPSHFYKNFHPAYVDRTELEARIRDRHFVSWMAFVTACRRQLITESADAPTLDSHRIVERTPTLVRLERNPYYFKIDPAGQQLPYIDRIESTQVDNQEIIQTMAATGRLDFSAFHLKTQNIPLLKLGEQTEDIRVLIWNRSAASDVVLQMNYNYPDARLTDVYMDHRFREALSLAINREEMNDIIYFGRGTPSQVTAHPSSSMFDQAFVTAYTRYDPDRARRLLDEMGLMDVDNDALREHRDGTPLVITLEFVDRETPKAISLELVSQYWQAVGIDLRLRLIDNSLQRERALANRMQMTVWQGDRNTDILLPIRAVWWAPVASGWSTVMWNDWARWYSTGGEIGTEPPPELRQLQIWFDQMRTALNPVRRIEFGRKLLKSNAENLWTIGTIGLAPHPVVISRHLRGVPEQGIWGWAHRWTMPYHPATWYFDKP